MAALCETREMLQPSGVVHSRAFYTETHDEDAMSVETPDTSSIETSDTSLVETPDTSSVETSDTFSVEAQDSSSVETQEEPLLGRVAHSMAYCKETRDVLVCDCYNWTIEQFSLSSSSGLSLQSQKLLKLDELYSISNPVSVHIARKIDSIFIGCDQGIYVLDRTSLQLVKKFAQNMNRYFDYVVVDETGDPEHSTVYASSINKDMLTKFDYSSGSVMRELPVTAPGNILLKDDKLYAICEIDSTDCILVIDKHSLEIQRKFALSGWSRVGGLCLDERRDICITARNESNHRILYSFDDGFNVVTSVRLAEFDEDAFVLDMVAADKDFIMLTQELDWQFTMKRIRMKL